jgi:hypothetical protein
MSVESWAVPIGPRAYGRLVEMPITAPMPNSAASVS